MLSSNEVDEVAVLTGTSGSLRLQPSELIESRKDADAILCASREMGVGSLEEEFRRTGLIRGRSVNSSSGDEENRPSVNGILVRRYREDVSACVHSHTRMKACSCRYGQWYSRDGGLCRDWSCVYSYMLRTDGRLAFPTHESARAAPPTIHGDE